MTAQLVVQFSGWVLLRLPTDPDPMDETRGVSGYTFAFADEPDLDRILHLQPPPDFTPRSHSPTLGVTVVDAYRLDGSARLEVPELVGGRVELLDSPKLENRNWNLSLPGYEPIWPFHFRISGQGLAIRRDEPLNADDPTEPVYLVPQADLAAHAARGMEFEPETIGRATGIWDGLAIVTERRAALARELDALRKDGQGESTAAIALGGRIEQLDYAIANPGDRRVVARFFVERFGFNLTGAASIEGDQSPIGGAIDATTPWPIQFWLGAWDPDLLCCYMEGATQIPLAGA